MNYLKKILTTVLILIILAGLVWLLKNTNNIPNNNQQSANQQNTAISQSTSPSPSAFVPLTDEPIMGFWFSEPQEIESTKTITGIRLEQWLPNNSTKMEININIEVNRESLTVEVPEASFREKIINGMVLNRATGQIESIGKTLLEYETHEAARDPKKL